MTRRNIGNEQPRGLERRPRRAPRLPGGEDAVATGKREMLAEVIGHRLAVVRRARGLTQQQVADRMGVTKGAGPRSNAARSPDTDSLDSWAPIVRDLPAVLSVEVQTLS